ncbi:EsaB/YukD family protein [Virgibacillus senegalensis]|uniref:EsaB/YukD family protein n=1 Tax=Virgibacillus senegalensis TaxID=1499679 RepID=UPI00069D957E|nr:EsaB/YukD family protein [Virgibacillus senegalensis]
MAKDTHINVTMDFRKRINGGGVYDLRIPSSVSVKQLLQYVMDTLNLTDEENTRSSIKVVTKNLLIADDDMLIDYPVTDGDILLVL